MEALKAASPCIDGPSETPMSTGECESLQPRELQCDGGGETSCGSHEIKIVYFTNDANVGNKFFIYLLDAGFYSHYSQAVKPKG